MASPKLLWPIFFLLMLIVRSPWIIEARGNAYMDCRYREANPHLCPGGWPHCDVLAFARQIEARCARYKSTDNAVPSSSSRTVAPPAPIKTVSPATTEKSVHPQKSVKPAEAALDAKPTRKPTPKADADACVEGSSSCASGSGGNSSGRSGNGTANAGSPSSGTPGWCSEPGPGGTVSVPCSILGINTPAPPPYTIAPAQAAPSPSPGYFPGLGPNALQNAIDLTALYGIGPADNTADALADVSTAITNNIVVPYFSGNQVAWPLQPPTYPIPSSTSQLTGAPSDNTSAPPNYLDTNPPPESIATSPPPWSASTTFAPPSGLSTDSSGNTSAMPSTSVPGPP